MRGEHSAIAGQAAPWVWDEARAAVILDLVAGGVRAEMGEAPYGWFDGDAPVAVTAPKVEKIEVAAVPAPVRAVEPVAEVVAAEVVVEGEGGGVVLVMRPGSGDARQEAALVKAMLAAVGLQEMALARVVLHGPVEAGAVVEKVRGLAGTRVLVLGQGPLSVLLGKNLGVEGWHAAGGGVVAGLEGMVAGVTYPPDLLLKQALFKRLAWQHLLAWRAAGEVA